MIKRLFDILLALTLVGPLAVIVFLAAVFVRLDSPGPAIFKQIRVGRYQKPFTLLKLRTMKIDTGDQASHDISQVQITKVGRILRKTKIDELPQILSVIKGDMSFVGPRPCLPIQTELIDERAKREVFSIRPGITGPAQIANIDMSKPLRLAKIDGQYVIEQSLRRDLSYVLATVLGKGIGDAVR